ncbi:TlpA family protein disulfide reductase [Cohnella boryungensis]|uniref:Thioredoxin-like domain-containing protein n=1 Tax=Cohnella boryungensis TaxID=768479 RepID=A0ABV8SCC3_9BACL
MDFRALFPKGSKTASPIEPLRPGQPFPLRLQADAASGKPIAVAVLSLYCSHCIEMLPELVAAVDRHRIPFVLVSNGSYQENENIAAYFKAPFPIVSVAEEELQSVYRVAQTPYFYLVQPEGIVADSFAAESGQEMADRWLRFGASRV